MHSARDRCSSQVAIHELDEFIIRCFGLLRTRPNRRRDAVTQMIAHELTTRRSQRLMHRCNLRQDIGAIAIPFYHALQASHLTFDPAQTLEVAFLYGRIDRDRLATIAVGNSIVGATSTRRVGGRRVQRGVLHVMMVRQGHVPVAAGDCQRRSRKELLTTDTELMAIAALARIGLSSTPKKG